MPRLIGASRRPASSPNACGPSRPATARNPPPWTSTISASSSKPLPPTFIAELRKKRDQYLRFLRYPDSLQPTLSTTNVVQAVNGQLERLRRNNGGDFQSEENLHLKLAIAMRYLEV